MLRLSLLLVAITHVNAVAPGDPVDWTNGEPQWWHDLKTSYGHQLRKCVFEPNIPDSGARCPGVATRSDHYYCLYGTDEKPTWFCTCLEVAGDYVFHCNDQALKTPEELENSGTPLPKLSPPPTNPPASSPTPPPAAVAPGTSDGRSVGPGDDIDWNNLNGGEPQWWHDLKNKYDDNLRKCVFLSLVPNTGESCPAVSSDDDYYFCLFGNSVNPTWFCTCRKVPTGYRFDCNNQSAKTPAEIEAAASSSTQPSDNSTTTGPSKDDTSSGNLQAAQPSSSGGGGGGGFTGGFFTGVAIMVVGILTFHLVKRYRNNRTGNNAADYPEVSLKLTRRPPTSMI